MRMVFTPRHRPPRAAGAPRLAGRPLGRRRRRRLPDDGVAAIRPGDRLHARRPAVPRVAQSRTWLLDDDGNKVRPLATEVGFWRPVADARPTAPTSSCCSPTRPGSSRCMPAWPSRPRSSCAPTGSCAARTAKEYTAGHRMYGYVNSDLMWVMDMAGDGPAAHSRTCRRSSSASSDRARRDCRTFGTSGRDEDVGVVVHRVGAQGLAEVGHALLVDDVDGAAVGGVPNPLNGAVRRRRRRCGCCAARWPSCAARRPTAPGRRRGCSVAASMNLASVIGLVTTSPADRLEHQRLDERLLAAATGDVALG